MHKCGSHKNLFLKVLNEISLMTIYTDTVYSFQKGLLYGFMMNEVPSHKT